MFNVLRAEEVRLAEKKLIDGGINEMFLRYNAALAVVDCAIDYSKAEDAKTAVFCGSGGNGYDGFIIAARLKKLGCKTAVYLVGDRTKFKRDALGFIDNEGVDVFDSVDYKGGANVLIDAIFGIGLNREIAGTTKELIDKLNVEDNAYRIAVDIPSGLDADSGEVLGTAFRADLTVTFSCYKFGMLFGKGKDLCGRIKVCDVGIKTESLIHVFDDGDFKPFKRNASAHKGTAGRVFVIGGCGNMIGAPLLAGAAAHAAYLNGAGTVTVCVPAIHRAATSARVAMAMMKYLPDTADGYVKFDKKSLDEIISRATAIDIGMGMGATPDLKKIVNYICENFCGTLIIDADALNAIKNDYGFLKSAKCKIILTPHVGEFRRLTGMQAIVENAFEFAENTCVTLVLKSATTIITDGNEIRLNIAGTPAMAKGGMGDVLGGCIAALSCSYSPIDAASVACYRNGMGAERAVSAYAKTMLTAKDVLEYAKYDEI